MPYLNIPQALATATAHHNAGRLAEAQTIYAQILAADPTHADALHLLGMARFQSGDPNEAVPLIRKAIEFSAATANYHINLGVVLDTLGRYDEAVLAFREAAGLRGDRADIYSNLGNTLRKARRYDESLEANRHATQLGPKSPQAHLNYGLALRECGRIDEAIPVLTKAVQLAPRDAQPLMQLSVALGQKGTWPASIDYARRAIAIQPNNPDTHNVLAYAARGAKQWPEAAAAAKQAIALNPALGQAWLYLGLAQRELGQIDEATQTLRRSIELLPNDPEGHNLFAHLLCEQGHFAESEAACRRALQLRPNYNEAYNNLGRALEELGRLDEAIPAYQQALALTPNFPEAHNNLGNALAAQGKIPEAINSHQTALSLRPDYPSAHWNLGLRYLALGDFERGWTEYESRWDIKQLGPRVHLTAPKWDGADLNGKRIALYAEQGFGDALQFVRYLPMVAQCGGKITLLARPELKSLMEKLEHVDRFVSTIEDASDCDVQIPLLSLPRIFGTRLDNIPATVPYLKAEPELAAKWKSRLPQDGRKKIGLVWANRPTPPNRCPPNGAWSVFAAAKNIWWCSLQKRDASVESRNLPADLDMTDWSEELTDFAETAALIDGLDLIVTVDTAVAHLAGAMAKPVWLLLKYAPDWRWMRDRGDSPWYPTMRLFRQPTLGDWITPMARMSEALAI